MTGAESPGGANGYERRRALAEQLRRFRESTAELVTAQFLERHAAWLEKYGDRARLHGIQDARFHVDFLAAAIEAGSLEAFRDYGAWCAGMLGSRGIESKYLVENLEQVRDAVVGGLDEAGRAWVEQMVAAACAAATEGGERRPPGGPSPSADDAVAADRRRYMEAALVGHRATALTIALECVRRGLSVPDVYHDLLQPVQYRIGWLWETNEISVAQEHMATAITQYVVAQLYSQLEIPEERRGRAVVTGVTGEHHQIGGSMVADVLESAGWDVRFLGSHLPHKDILRAVEEHEPRVLGISATMLYNLPAVAALTADTRRLFGPDVRVVVGGGAFRAAPGAWRDLGADAYGKDLRDALRVIDSLSGDAG
jgi:MerR family transcriptional regulator, light-induced transcriptional regulator